MKPFCLLCVLVFLTFGKIDTFARISADNDQDCSIELKSKDCENQSSCCSYVQFAPNILLSPFLSLMSLIGFECQCKADCRRKLVKCKHGYCNSSKKKCVCSSCYNGDTCQTYENPNPPKFTSNIAEIIIPGDFELYRSFYKATATDKDNDICLKKKDCSCGKIFFSLKNNYGVFFIDKLTGSIMLKDRPSLLRYHLEIVASNKEIDTEDEFGNMTTMLVKVIRIEGSTNQIDPDLSSRHRSKRAVPDQTSPALILEALPYLEDTYYFNKGDRIRFLIRAIHNVTAGSAITNIELYVQSELLLIDGADKLGFDSVGEYNGVYIFNTTTTILNSGNNLACTVNASVKTTVGPLSSLFLLLEAEYTYDGQQYGIKNVESTPTVYGVFPVVEVNRSTEAPMEVYSKLPFTMFIKLPKLNYSLYVEITTAIEDFVFMSIGNVLTNYGPAVEFNGSRIAVPYSSQNDSNYDRSSINFGYLQIDETSLAVERYVNISFDVQFNDHPLLENGSNHYIGVGLQAGPKVLWVEQFNVSIIKTEPTLKCELVSYMITNFTRIYIGDRLNISLIIDHTTTSGNYAYNVSINVYIEHAHIKSLNDSSSNPQNISIGSSNYTTEVSKISIGTTKYIDLELTFQDDIYPLLEIPILVQVDYKNKLGFSKLPVVESFDRILTGTPMISLVLSDGQPTSAIPGNRRTFNLIILLTRMRAPLVIEIVMPKANGFPVFTILSFTVDSIGNNIKGLNDTNTYSAVLDNTTSNSYMKDQARIDLGTALNNAETDEDQLENQIKLSFETIVNENDNLTTSQTYEYRIGAGIISQPSMAWIGQTMMNVYVLENEKPVLDFNFTGNLDGDFYTFNTSIRHKNTSNMFAHNVTFQYYLPPFLEFFKVESASNGIQEDGQNTRYKYVEPVMYFTDEIKHSITAKIVYDKSDREGAADYIVPFRLSYSNKRKERKHYWKSVKETMNVLRKDPIIPKSTDAKQHYYGRGYYYDTTNKVIYVCSNQHTPSSQPSCYLSSDGVNFTRIDSRVGCVIGHHPATNDLYGIARNQLAYLKYNKIQDDWSYVTDVQFQKVAQSWSSMKYKNIEAATAFGVAKNLEKPEYVDDIAGDKKWIGTGDGLYHVPSGIPVYILSAKWILYG